MLVDGEVDDPYRLLEGRSQKQCAAASFSHCTSARDSLSSMRMRTFLQDLKYGVRLLGKSPAFTAVAVLSLTLGIGANSTIFTLAKTFFLESVPVKDPARVVSLYSNAQSRKGPPQEYLPTPYPNAMDYREKTNVFSGSSIAIFTGLNLVVSGKQVQLFGELVNGNFFDVLGVQPFLGRGFLPEEDASPRPVAVLSFALWNTQFGGDRGILGRKIQLNQQDFTVIGVAPREFHNVGVLGSPDLWIPVSMRDQMLDPSQKKFLYERGFRMVAMVARLKPEVNLKQAQIAVHMLGEELEKEYPKENGGRNEMLVPINETTIPPRLHNVFVRAGALMMLIVSLVLLIRVRERGEFAAGSRDATAARNWREARNGSGANAVDPAVAYREPAAGDPGRCAGNSPRILGEDRAVLPLAAGSGAQS